MRKIHGSGRHRLLGLARDRRGVAVIEAVFVLPLFLSLMFVIIEIGIYFMLQSSLDVGVLTTAETLRTTWQGATSCSPSPSTLKTSIRTNGGALLSLSNLAVDVRLLSTLSSSAVAIVDGGVDSGGSGLAMVLRAQTTMPMLPGVTLLTMTSASIVRCPLY
ncbi:MAG: TadE/TadG family type IV pilus assembly protein [Rhodopila sp.]|jgi:Flp pilus assembly protein TadG